MNLKFHLLKKRLNRKSCKNFIFTHQPLGLWHTYFQLLLKVVYLQSDILKSGNSKLVLSLINFILNMKES